MSQLFASEAAEAERQALLLLAEAVVLVTKTTIALPPALLTLLLLALEAPPHPRGAIVILSVHLLSGAAQARLVLTLAELTLVMAAVTEAAPLPMATLVVAAVLEDMLVMAVKVVDMLALVSYQLLALVVAVAVVTQAVITLSLAEAEVLAFWVKVQMEPLAQQAVKVVVAALVEQMDNHATLQVTAALMAVEPLVRIMVAVTDRAV